LRIIRSEPRKASNLSRLVEETKEEEKGGKKGKEKGCRAFLTLLFLSVVYGLALRVRIPVANGCKILEVKGGEGRGRGKKGEENYMFFHLLLCPRV